MTSLKSLRQQSSTNKVAIFYVLAGVGHYRVALSIKKALLDKSIKSELIDPFDVLAASGKLPAQLSLSVILFGFKLFKYYMLYFTPKGEEPGHFSFVSKTLIKISRKLEIWLGKNYSRFFGNYDTIISAHPMATGIARGLSKKSKARIFNVFPDEGNNTTILLYVNKKIPTFVNSPELKEKFQSFGADKVIVSGHAVDPILVKNREKIFSRIQTSLKKGKLVAGFYSGAFFPIYQQDGIIDGLTELIPIMKSGNARAKVLVGVHEKFGKRVKRFVQRNQIENYVDIVPANSYEEMVEIGHDWMLKEINVMLSRPSELGFYSLACGLPHFVFRSLGSQEEDMTNLLLRNGGLVYKKAALRNARLVDLSKKQFNSGYLLDGGKVIAKQISSLNS